MKISFSKIFLYICFAYTAGVVCSGCSSKTPLPQKYQGRTAPSTSPIGQKGK